MYMVICDYIDTDGTLKSFHSKDVKSIVYKDGTAYIQHDKNKKLAYELDQLPNVADMFVIDKETGTQTRIEIIIE